MTLKELLDCCGSSAWANAMFEQQPFQDHLALHEAADQIWWAMGEEDWLEAFSKHPKIGERLAARWSAQEQRGMDAAPATTAEKMAQLNAKYYERFGFIFIVCATGRSAEEMLQLLEVRLMNTRDRELRIAAAEQAKITHLRLEKLLIP